MGNPENEFPYRMDMGPKALGFKDQAYIYQIFTPDEMSEIEAEALEKAALPVNDEMAVEQQEVNESEGNPTDSTNSS